MPSLKPELRSALTTRIRGVWLLVTIVALMALTSAATWLAAAALRTDGPASAQHPSTLIKCESPADRQPGMLLRCTVPPVGPTLEI